MESWAQIFMRFLVDDFFMSDEFLATFVPVVLYWAYSTMYMLLPTSLDRYRLHPKQEANLKNSVTKAQVVKGVLLQQSVQTIVAVLTFALAGGRQRQRQRNGSSSPLVALSQLFVAMVATDTYQYFTHWCMHRYEFLYRHVHCVHHRVVVTHAFGALYGHPVWDGIIDTVGGGVGFWVSGMSPRTAVVFYSLCVVKVVDDHCGMWVPGNPFHLLFANNSAYHDFHHQLAGGRYNLSQPFFVTWDKIMGTYMPVAVEERRSGGGYLVATVKGRRSCK